MQFKGLMIISLSMFLFACSSEPTSPTSNSTVNPKAAVYNVELGVGYLRQGNYQRAKQKLLLALQQDPHSAAAYSAMAYFLEKTGEYNKAEDDYKKAISLAENPGAMENNYGTFLCRRGRYVEAETEFIKAAQDPNYLNPANPLENAGLCALLIPNTAQAIQYFQAALQKNPQMKTSMLQLSEIYYSEKNYDQANKYLSDLLKTVQPNAEILWLGIRLAEQKGDHNTANHYGALLKAQFSSSSQYSDYLKLKSERIG